MKTLEEQFYEYAVVPVVVLDDADDAAPLAEALIKDVYKRQELL